MPRLRFLSLAILAAFAGSLHAQATLDGLKLGTHVLGPKVTTNDLKGRVVLFEYWGVNCPPCIRSIPHLGELQEHYGRETLVIVANQCQTQDTGEAAAKWKESGGNETVSVINFGDLPGSNVSGIPRCFLFDHRGELVYDGSPFEIDATLQRTCDAAPGSMAAGMDYQILGKEAAFFARCAGNFRSTLDSVERILQDEAAEPRAKEEAAFLLDRVKAWAESGHGEVEALQTSNPVACMAALEERHGLLKGTALDAWYAERLDSLKNDRTFANELSAYEAYLKILRKAQKSGVLEPPQTRSDEGKQASFAKSAQSFIKRYEGTIAATRMAEVVARLGAN